MGSLNNETFGDKPSKWDTWRIRAVDLLNQTIDKSEGIFIQLLSKTHEILGKSHPHKIDYCDQLDVVKYD